jgi:hypothetical protein
MRLYNGPTDAAFATWNMLSSIGPIGGTGKFFQWSGDPFPLVNTSAGVLSIRFEFAGNIHSDNRSRALHVRSGRSRRCGTSLVPASFLLISDVGVAIAFRIRGGLLL